MIENNWENFLKNLGEWRGTFTRISLEGKVLDSTPSILTLEGMESDRLVRFRLRRYGADGFDGEPERDNVQEYRSVGNQNIFFETGAFSKGSIQFSPVSEFGAEYGFVAGDRRLRFVQLYDRNGNLDSLTLIREFRAESNATERPQLTVDQLLGNWEGTAQTVYSDWTPTETTSTRLEIQKIASDRLQQKLTFGQDQSATQISTTAKIEENKLIFDEGKIPRQILLLPDGTSSNTPSKIELRSPFFVELGWLVEPNERQRLIRSYNEKGEWISATFVREHKIA